TKEDVTTMPEACVMEYEDNKDNIKIQMDRCIITEARVKRAIMSMKKNKAAGVDDIISDMLIENVNGVAKLLTIIFDKSLKTGEVSHDWKLANISPIFKKGSKKDPGNYRPVSLTCQAGNIL